jgi:E3 ubiquitin-protein ligase NEDD4
VEKQTQEKLRNLLHYVTGTTRVPILGFKYLESNRNQIVQFMIEKTQNDKANPYPKSYTCFNRLQLPAYSSKEEMF